MFKSLLTSISSSIQYFTSILEIRDIGTKSFKTHNIFKSHEIGLAFAETISPQPLFQFAKTKTLKREELLKLCLKANTTETEAHKCLNIHGAEGDIP